MYLLTTKKFSIERQRDRDLLVDRTPIVEIERPILTYPSTGIYIGGTAKILISNYNPNLKYDVSVNKGSARLENNILWYTAPEDDFGSVIFSFEISYASLNPLVIFDDFTAYDYEGNLISVEKVSESKFFYGVQEYDYVESKKYVTQDFETEIEIKPSPVPSRRTFGDVELGDFKIEETFGKLGSRRLTPVDLKSRRNNIGDYHVPEDRDKLADSRKYLYRVRENKFISIPRNSNVSQSFGDVFDGYAEPRFPGGSLTVIGNDMDPKNFDLDTEIELFPLEAILPPSVLALCLTQYQLTPILVGNELGHFFEWEQISGDKTDITWLAPKDQLTLHIAIGKLKVDRVFRFWISRGTKYEKYYDLIIYGTPIDTLDEFVYTRDLFRVSEPYLAKHKRDNRPVLLTSQRIYDKQLKVNVKTNY